jgi:thiol:disulfide interchange protein DsbD
MLFRTLLCTLCVFAGTQAAGQDLPGGDATGLNTGNQVPTVDEAFGIDASHSSGASSIQVTFDLLESTYLYRKHMDFRLETPDGEKVSDFSELDLPPGQDREDEFLGDVQVFEADMTLSLPLPDTGAGEVVLLVDYQGCLEDRLCYPPQTRRLEIGLSGEEPGPGEPAPAGSSAKGDTGQASGFLATLQSADAHAFSNWMQGHNLGMVVLLFFAGGLLLAFTPCVFPMIPILSGIIAGEANPSAYRGFTLSLAYVLGVAIPYTLAGLLVAIFGAGVNLQYWLQQPAAIISAAVVFGVLSLAMFGLYELQLPAFLRDRLNQAGHQRGGSLLGAGLMGVISALIVSPCVTPILAGALVYVAGTGDALTGASSLFALSMGMGVPLLLVGTGGASVLPRAGAWMDDIKHLFGVLMLGVAIWLLDRILPGGVTLALYGMLLAVYGVQLGALEPGGEYRLRRGVALLLTLYGVVMLIGAASGGKNPWQPLAHLQPTATSTSEAGATADKGGMAQWRNLEGQAALERQLEEARQAEQPVLVDFFAEWCVACRILEEETLSHPEVLEALAGFRLLRVDITEVTAENRALMEDFEVLGLPTLMFRTGDGAEIPESRVLGEMGPDRFREHLNEKVFPAISQ